MQNYPPQRQALKGKRYYAIADRSVKINDMTKKPTKSRNLLSILQEMYSNVVCTILNNRMQQYCARHSMGCDADISYQLSQHIDSITDSHKNKKRTTHTENTKHQKQTVKSVGTTQTLSSGHPLAVNTKKVNELSKYFKQRGNGATLKPGIKDTLTHSTWEHIHMSLRLARQCNTKGAKMHADIANHAYKELAHYMPEEKYIELTREIEKELETINKTGM